MTAFFHKVYRWLLFVFHQPTLEQKTAKRVRKKQSGDNENVWYKFGDMLDTLDKYYEHIKSFKNGDPESYALYSRIGGTIVPEKSFRFNSDELPASFRAGKRPAFGCVHFKTTEIEEEDGDATLVACFLYFQKFSKSWLIQPSKNDIYSVTVFYYDKKKKGNFFGSIYVSVDDVGNITALKEKAESTQVIRAKSRSSKRSGRNVTITRHVYKYPPFIECLQDEDARKKKPIRSGEQIVKEIFCGAVNSYDAATSGLQVRCEKNSVKVIFHIDMLRTPYFFKNREKTVTINGRTKPIFHIVRVHERKKADGSSTYVKTHFRGVRYFTWLGYSVCISMQGRHHADLKDFTANGVEVNPELTIPSGYVNMKDMAGKIDGYMWGNA